MDALLEGKSNRAQRILRQLMLEESEPIILIRTAQKSSLNCLNGNKSANSWVIWGVFLIAIVSGRIEDHSTLPLYSAYRVAPYFGWLEY